MSLTNHISLEFSKEEMEALEQHLSAVEEILRKKLVNIPQDQHNLFNRIGDGNYPLVEKTAGYKASNKHLLPEYMNDAEFDKDYMARNQLAPIHRRIISMENLLDDSLRYLDTDIWNFVLTFYQNVKLQANQGISNARTVFDDLSKRFPGRKKAGEQAMAASKKNDENRLN